MFDSVLAFGDSHVAGFEITDPIPLLEQYQNKKITLEELDTENKKFAFPNIVAEKLNIPCFNYSLTAGSNNRSLRLLPQAVLEHPNSLVLFCYSSVDRSEFYRPENDNFYGKDLYGYLQVGMHLYHPPESAKDEFTNSMKKTMKMDINDFYVENILTVEKDENNILNLMFYVEQICKNYSKDFRHLLLNGNLLNSVPDLFSNNLCRDKIINFENSSNSGHGSFFDFCSERFDKRLYGHFGIDAHQAVAKKIIDSLQ
jgi:hypothetical protein